jgi:hypothetical protein
MSKITTKPEGTCYVMWTFLILFTVALLCGGTYKGMSPQAQYDTVSVIKEFFGSSENPSKADKPLMEDVYYWTNSPEYWKLQEARAQQRAEELAADPEKQKQLEDMLAKMARKD